jgi:anti-sigma28 factor (negative regulator of flagellin synthesis)
MRIDLNTRVPDIPRSGKSARTDSASPANSMAGELAPHEARLSLHARVQALEAGVRGLPEVRQDKVAALQRATRDGTYNASAGQIAEAIFRELSFLGTPALIRGSLHGGFLDRAS